MVALRPFFKKIKNLLSSCLAFAIATAHAPAFGDSETVTCPHAFAELHRSFIRFLDTHPTLAKAIRVGEIAFYPTTAPLRIAANTLAATPNPRELAALRKAFSIDEKTEGRNFRLYIATVVGPWAIIEGGILYGKGSASDRELRKQLPDPPGVKVIVEAFENGNALYGSQKSLFQKRYSNDANAIFLRVRSLNELKEKLVEIRAKHGEVQLMEIAAHGSEGQMHFPDGPLNSEKVGKKLTGVFAKGAGIRLVSCNVANTEPHKENDLASSLGRNLLDQGGKIVASNRFVAANEMQGSRPLDYWLLSAAEGMGVVALSAITAPATSTLIPFQTIRDFPDFIKAIQTGPKQSFRVVEILPGPSSQ